MWAVVVVSVQPVGGHLPNFLQRLEEVAVQNLGAVGLVESLDICVSCGLNWLDVIEGNALGLGPLRQGVGDEFRAAVRANGQGRTTLLDQLVQGREDLRRRQVRVHFHARALGVELVDHVEGPEASSGPQCVGYEVAVPPPIALARRFQRLFDASRPALLATTRQVQPQLAAPHLEQRHRAMGRRSSHRAS